MRRALLVSLVAVAIPSSLLAADPVVRLVDFDIEVTSASADRVVQAIDDAEKDGDALVLIRLDTPGGSVDALETIQKRMLAAKVPVVAWVGPSGAHAASAGFLLLVAADVAAMAPGTRTGAASPVTFFGGDLPETMKKKVENDLVAGARSIAEHRGRNVEKIEKAVLEANAYSDQTALAEGLIDLVAGSREDLVAKLDGRTVRRFDGSTLVLATHGASFARSVRTWQQDFWEALASPTLAFLLLVLGAIGLYTEFTHPGLTFPGVGGALCLLLFALTSRVLPISLVGLLLILLGLVLLILELKIVSHGLLTLGGVACIVIGSVMLIPGPIPEMRVPLAVVLPGSLTLAGFCAVAVRLSVAARRAPVTTGAEGLRGETGIVEDELSPEGKVFVHGELWNAVSVHGAIARGTQVQVVRVDGMRIVVEPKPAPAGGQA